MNILLEPTVSGLKRKKNKNEKTIESHRTKPGRVKREERMKGYEHFFKETQWTGPFSKSGVLNALRMNFLVPGEKMGVVILLHHVGVTPRTQATQPHRCGNLTSKFGCCLLSRFWWWRQVEGGGKRGPSTEGVGQRLPLTPWQGGAGTIPSILADSGTHSVPRIPE